MSQGTPTYQPFRPKTSASTYVPRADTERALDAMQRWALGSASPVLVLSGPPGIGKTLLLKVLATRLGVQRSCVYLPYSELSARELSEWVLNALRKQRGDDPVATLAREAESLRRQGPALLLLIDDAARLPAETARALAEWTRAEASALRLVLVTGGAGTDTVMMQTLGRGATHVTLQALLTRSEAATLLRAEIGRTGVDPEIRARFGLAVLASVYEASQGVPARLFQEAARHLPRYQDVDLPLSTEPSATATQRPEPIATAADTTETPPAPRGSAPPRPPAPVAWVALGAALGIAATLGMEALWTAPPPEPARILAPVSAPPPLPRAPNPTTSFERPIPDPVAAAPMIPEVRPEPAQPVLAEPQQIVTEGVIAPGGWLAAALRERGVPDAIGALIAREMGTLFDFRQSRPGHRFHLVRSADGQLLAFDYTISPRESIHLRLEGGRYVARRKARELSEAPSRSGESGGRD